MRKSFVAALGVAAAAGAAQAGVSQTFFAEDLGGTVAGSVAGAESAFLSNLIGVGTEDFESFSDGDTGLSLVFPGAGTATLNGAGEIEDAPGAGRFAVSGSNYYEARLSTNAADNFSISFSEAVAAFGFYGTDIGDFGSELTLELQGGGTLTVPIPHTTGSGGSTNGSVFYFGVIVDAADVFTSITFSGTTTSDAFGFDDMTIGSLEQVVPIPLPSAAGLGLVGMGALAARRRR